MKKFNLKNPTEVRLIRILAHGEGIISRQQILEVSNKTMLSRYISAGYLTKCKNGSEDIYQATGKFHEAYRREIDPAHKFSGSGSPVHSAGLNRAILQIPEEAKLKSGQTLKMEFDKYRKTIGYHQALAAIQAREYKTLQETEKEFAGAVPESEKAYANFRLNVARSNYELACDEHKACSAPDLAVTLDLCQLENWRANLGNYYLNHDLTHYKMALLHQTIERLQELERTYTGPVTVCVEIVTGSYGPVEIQQKENYAETTGSILVYLPA